MRSDLHKYIAKNFTTVCKSKGFLSIEFDDLKEIFAECSSMKGIDLTQYQFCAMLSWVAARSVAIIMGLHCPTPRQTQIPRQTQRPIN